MFSCALCFVLSVTWAYWSLMLYVFGVIIYLSIPCCTGRKYISNSTMKVDMAFHIQIAHVQW